MLASSSFNGDRKTSAVLGCYVICERSAGSNVRTGGAAGSTSLLSTRSATEPLHHFSVMTVRAQPWHYIDSPVIRGHAEAEIWAPSSHLGQYGTCERRDTWRFKRTIVSGSALTLKAFHRVVVVLWLVRGMSSCTPTWCGRLGEAVEVYGESASSRACTY